MNEPPDQASEQFVFQLLEGARRHGENSEPDHEVGDLQTFLIACWTVMTPEQRVTALLDKEVQSVLDGIDYEDIY